MPASLRKEKPEAAGSGWNFFEFGIAAATVCRGNEEIIIFCLLIN
jgi:hypothetical protein